MTEDEARAIVAPLYQALTASTPRMVEELLTGVTTPDWRNCSGNEACETRNATITRWSGRVAVVPGMAWEERDLLVSGDRVVVRGGVAGTPAATFLGVEPTGRGFSLMIDVHRIRHGRIAETHHAENWAQALRHLTGSP